VRQDAVTRDRRYGPLMAKRSEEEEEYLTHTSKLAQCMSDRGVACFPT